MATSLPCRAAVYARVSTLDQEPENQLAESFGVSRLTVHRALRELTEKGILKRVALKYHPEVNQVGWERGAEGSDQKNPKKGMDG